MLLNIQRKGKKIFMNGDELQEYMSVKLNELSGLGANMIIALIMTSLVVVLSYFKARDIFFYAVILIPLIGRWYVGNMVNKWLNKKFRELLRT